jgi:FAD/FMN-containing dehydrogenase
MTGKARGQIVHQWVGPWGRNFERLQQIKKALDPQNLFNHGQSIPLPKS